MTRDLRSAAGVFGTSLVAALTLVVAVAAAQAPPAGSKRMPRAYEGAPPLVPHDVEARKGLCQDCHAAGEQGAPITPHPTRTHFCVQCHVGQDQSVRPFVEAKTRQQTK